MSDSTPEHLFVVSYADETERKRVEYLFDNWAGGSVDRPEGLVRLAADVDHEELYEQLLTKVPEEQVSAYALDRSEPSVERERATVEREVSADLAAVESFLGYVFSKRKGKLRDAGRNEYDLYTKKGRAEARYTLSETVDGTAVRVTIEGYPPAPEFLREFFADELAEFSESQKMS